MERAGRRNRRQNPDWKSRKGRNGHPGRTEESRMEVLVSRPNLNREEKESQDLSLD
jgi:hypothetical protein